MKLQRKNKYVGLIATMLSIGMLVGCGDEEFNADTSETNIIQESALPETTQSESTQASMEELPYDEEIALLGMAEPDLTVSYSMLNIVEYQNGDDSRVMLTYIGNDTNENGGYDVYEWFTEEKVFTIDYNIFGDVGAPAIYDINKMTIVNESLKDAELINSFGLEFLDPYSAFILENYKKSEYYNEASANVLYHKGKTLEEIDEIFYMPRTNLEIADLYLDIVPKEYRVKADELVIDNKVLTK